MAFKLVKLYHPSHRVLSLEKADKFFNNVFGISSVWRESLFTKPDPKYSTYPNDYCIFTTIADVFFDCIDPKKYVIDGAQRYADVKESHLNGFGWGVEGIDEIYEKIQTIGVVPTDQANRLSDPKECPTAAFKRSKLFYTLAESSGVRLEFYPVESIGVYDPRKDPTWQLHPQQGKGPLGIQFCSHHTILTVNLERALKIYVDLLGGKIIHEETNTLRGTDSVYVALADAIHELAVPKKTDSYAMKDFMTRENPSEDVYHALTWKVLDLKAAEAHLQAQGVRITVQDENMIVVDPEDGIGIPWGFVARSLPNDDRYLQSR